MTTINGLSPEEQLTDGIGGDRVNTKRQEG